MDPEVPAQASALISWVRESEARPGTRAEVGTVVLREQRRRGLL